MRNTKCLQEINQKMTFKILAKRVQIGVEKFHKLEMNKLANQQMLQSIAQSRYFYF